VEPVVFETGVGGVEFGGLEDLAEEYVAHAEHGLG